MLRAHSFIARIYPCGAQLTFVDTLSCNHYTLYSCPPVHELNQTFLEAIVCRDAHYYTGDYVRAVALVEWTQDVEWNRVVMSKFLLRQQCAHGL